MRRFVLTVVALTTIAVFSDSVSASTIALFKTDDLSDPNGVNDVSDSPELGLGDTTPGATSSDLTLGTGVSGQNWPNTLDPTGFFGNASLADAIGNDDYLTVTTTADAGKLIDYTNFHVVLGANVGDGIMHLMSSVGGFGVADQSFQIDYVGGPGGAVPPSVHDIDITSLGAVAGDVEFRLYLTQTPNRVGIGQAFNINADEDSLRIDGRVADAIPEPASALLLTLGAMIGAGVLRRRK